VSSIPSTIGRARLEQTPAGLRIVIPPLRSSYLFLESPIIVVLVVAAMRQLDVPIVVWILVCAILVAGLGRRWLWNLLGREIVTINKVALTLRYDFGGVGWQRTYFLNRLYRMCFVRLMTVQEMKGGSDNSPVGFVGFDYDAPASRYAKLFSIASGLIRIDYDPQSPRFGKKLGEAEVQELIGVMETYSGAHLASTQAPPPHAFRGEVIAQETNSNWGVTYVMFMLTAAVYFLGTLLDVSVLRYGAFLASLLFAGVAILALAGYQYRFTRDGVEISTLGIQVLFIPADRITHWEEGTRVFADSYSFGFYGRRKAYVWAGRGIRIHSLDGEFFIGHMKPEILLRDLELMKQAAAGGRALGQAAGAGANATEVSSLH
jgi:hypothetical protein